MSSTPSVHDIQTFESIGPWRTKSGGKLDVLFLMSQNVLRQFLDFDNPAFDELSENIRGLRSYMVSDIPEGSIGGQEWHKVRNEYITALAGSALLECVDRSGSKQEFMLNGHTGVIIPHHILHTYQALEDSTTLQVITNTLFVPDSPTTYDTYPANSFS